jgi:hypothetical protein
MYAIYEFIYLCVWHLQQISVYGIYVFIYIYVHLMLWNQQICKIKKILGHHTPTALPSA